jgi:hypothetical protein
MLTIKFFFLVNVSLVSDGIGETQIDSVWEHSVKRTHEPEGSDVPLVCRKLRPRELHNVHPSSNIVFVIRLG